MFNSLLERIEDYQSCYDYKLTKKLPIVIKVQGSSFKRLTKHVEKPYDASFGEFMASVMMSTISEMPGALLGYNYSDEFIFVLRNDQSFETVPWCGNKIQDIVSMSSNIITNSFHNNLLDFSNNFVINGNPIFKCGVYSLPNLSEVANNLILKQQDCMNKSINSLIKYNLSKRMSNDTINHLIKNSSFDQKVAILHNDCGVDIDSYPKSYTKGIITSKSPTIICDKSGKEFTRNKWRLNYSIPDFSKEKDYIFNILVNGHDVYRK